MSRFLAVLLAALACAFAYLVATGIALPEAATVQAMFVVSSVALLVSASAIAIVLAMAGRLRAQRIELRNLARSVDAAFADLASRRDRGDDASMPPPEMAEAKTMARDGKIPSSRDDADRRPIEIGNVMPHPAAPGSGPVPAGASGRPDIPAMEPTPDIRLRPLRTTATDGIAGFDVLPSGSGQNGASAGRRKPLAANGETAAALERGLVLAAIETSSQPGFAGERAPLHVAVSHALLADREELAIVAAALKRLNGTARSIVLTLPTKLMENPAQHAAALAKLAAARSRLASDGWPSSAAGVEMLWRSGVSFLRLPAARLLSRDGGPNPIGAASLVQMLASSGMTVIATDAGVDAGAAELARLGVTLMSEARPPAAVRPHAGNDAGDVIHI
jgi:hypothetical protein